MGRAVGRGLGMLDAERVVWQRLRADLLQRCPGRYVLIVDDDLIGDFATFDDAYRAGLDRFGRRDMLIQHVVADEPETATTAPALLVGLTNARIRRATQD